MSASQGLEIGENLLWKHEETRHFGFFLWSQCSFIKDDNTAEGKDKLEQQAVKQV